jgi:mono/diheme cytochrome c family protein
VRIVKVVAGLGIALTAVAVIGYGVLYATSERMMARIYDVPLSDYAAPTDVASLAEGERLARIRGCIGCHGMEMEGYLFLDDPWLARIVAPDLTLMAQEYSDAELERVIRKGVRRDGRTVWVMPSPMFAHLSDDDLNAIIAYMRSVAPHGGPATEFRLGPVGRLGVVLGQFPPLADEIDSDVHPLAPDRADPMALGRYLAMTTCSECHGADLHGAPDGSTPPLNIVAAYAPDPFRRLMKDGIGIGDRELGLMTNVSLDRFSYFTDDELHALHTYLQSMTLAAE